MPRTGRPRKDYPFEDIHKLHFEKKWGNLRIARELRLPRSSVSNILRRFHSTPEGDYDFQTRLPEEKLVKYMKRWAECHDNILDVKTFEIFIRWVELTLTQNSLLELFEEGRANAFIRNKQVVFQGKVER